MDVVASIPSLGLTVSVEQVATWIMTVGVGILASFFTEETKALLWSWVEMVPERFRPTLYRSITAAACVLLNILATLLFIGSVEWALLPQVFVSYFTAVTTFDHLLKPKESPAPEQEFQ